MPTYAKGTTVPVEKSKTDIEKALMRWGATGFMFAWEEGISLVAFKYNGLQARIPIPMPDRDGVSIIKTSAGYARNPTEQKKVYDQAVRQRWRALLLMVKAKLEAIESEITTFEQEFLPYIVLPDGRSVADSLMPGIYGALESGHMPPMLPEGT